MYKGQVLYILYVHYWTNSSEIAQHLGVNTGNLFRRVNKIEKVERDIHFQFYYDQHI